MKKIIIFNTLTFLLCTWQYVDSQELSTVFKENDYNFLKTVKYINENPIILEKASAKEIKMYHRWQWFWSSRIDSTGDITKMGKTIYEYYKTQYHLNNSNPQKVLQKKVTIPIQKIIILHQGLLQILLGNH